MVPGWKIYVGFLVFLMVTESIQNNLSSFLQFLLGIVLPTSYLWFL